MIMHSAAQVSGAKTRLSFAMKNGDAADLASALTWAAEVGNRGSGQLTEVCLMCSHATCLHAWSTCSALSLLQRLLAAMHAEWQSC